MTTVALVTDREGLPGLHVTLASLLSNTSDPTAFRTVVFTGGLRPRDERLIRETVRRVAPTHDLQIRSAVYELPAGLPALRSSYMTYVRLFLPGLLPDAADCLYLDIDLIVTGDVLELIRDARAQPEAHVAAHAYQERRESLDARLMARVGLPLDGPYFNAGVLFMNLARWREDGTTATGVRFLGEYRDEIVGHDQAALNCCLADRFSRLDARWNQLTYPASPAGTDRRAGIIHFIGAPKPWDFLAGVVHNSAGLWRQNYCGTAHAADWRVRWEKFTAAGVKIRALPATARRLKQKILGR